MAVTPRELESEFRQIFKSCAQPAIYRAPGRVNLMGEHTDYNQGLVCPIALEMACYIAVAPAQHDALRIHSAELGETREFPIAKIADAEPQRNWTDYVVGVARLLVRNGVALTPSDLYIHSDVPRGSGLSSSAALEVSASLSLLAGRPMDRREIAQLCRRAESEFVGMPCGIMDQYTSLFGTEGAAIQIDCRNLTHIEVKLPAGLQVIAVNSMVKHELASSAYSQRVAECAQAVSELRAFQPGIASLRDVSVKVFEEVQDSLSPVPRKRARHIITDIARVLDFAAAARANDVREMGRLFIAAHRSMQYDYEITSDEIDFLVDTAIKMKGVYGARMTGGGFGGCTVNLVDPNFAEDFAEQITAAYRKRHGKTPLFYDCQPGASASRVK